MGDFDALYASLSEDDRIRGLEFERVCKWFLENDPVYSHELKRVWLWRDWPGRWGGDAGIDLVGEDRNGELWAIQAKAYKPKYRVSKKDSTSSCRSPAARCSPTGCSSPPRI